MNRTYKLAANFNTVEFTVTEDDLLSVLDFENEVEYEDDIPCYSIPNEELIKRVLQREYDILSSIKVVNVAPPAKDTPKVDPPSEKQCEWARALGMKNPEKKSKKEVWRYIQSHKDDEI